MDWTLFEYDPVTQRRKYMKITGSGASQLLHVRETMPCDAIIEANKVEANEWKAKGGWKAAKHGAVVARVPVTLENEFKRMSGYEPRTGQYDRNKYNAILDDSDYRHLRTGGGKLGKRLKQF